MAKPITSITVHLWQGPFQAFISDLDSDACAVRIAGDLALFLPARHRAKAEAVVALLNEIGAPLAPQPSQMEEVA